MRLTSISLLDIFSPLLLTTIQTEFEKKSNSRSVFLPRYLRYESMLAAGKWREQFAEKARVTNPSERWRIVHFPEKYPFAQKVIQVFQFVRDDGDDPKDGGHYPDDADQRGLSEEKARDAFADVKSFANVVSANDADRGLGR